MSNYELLKDCLTEYLAIPVDRIEGIAAGVRPIKFYSFEAGFEPSSDSYEEVESSRDAIQVADREFWTFGLGIQLEMGANVLPRYSYQWWVRVKYEGKNIECRLGMKENQAVYLNAPFVKQDLLPLCQIIYEGLLFHLSGTAGEHVKQRALGFRIIPE